jgi:phospholipid/cholesterol/gamma-HCH transport system substrate-binding protein
MPDAACPATLAAAADIPHNGAAMKREHVNYTLVGIVVAIALAGLLATLAAVTGRGGASAEYTVVYRNVTGLGYGAPVFYEGFRIGQVEGIEPERVDGRTRYRVRLAIRADWPIPTDSVAQLASTGLLADVAIAIREGEATELLAAGSEIPGAEGGDVFAAVNELAGEVTTLTRTQITPLIQTLGQRVASITASVDNQTPLLLAQAQTLLERLNDAASAVNDVLADGNRDNIAATLSNIRTITDELGATQAKLDQLLADSAGIAAENRPLIRDAVRDLSQITTAMARRIDAIAHNLESSSRNFDEFTREIRRNPNRLIFTPEADDVIVEDEP